MTEGPDRGAADGRGSPTLHRGSGVVQDEGVVEKRLCVGRRGVVRRPNKECNCRATAESMHRSVFSVRGRRDALQDGMQI